VGTNIDIRYIAAPPGTGKTKAAVEYMRRHIIRGVNGKDVGYVFYVAPTIALLDQTIAYLKERLKGKKYRNRIHRCVSSKQQSKSVKERILELLDGRVESTMVERSFGNGSILFITHPAFVELDWHSSFEKTVVLFDEARKWAEMTNSIKLTPEVERFFDKLFITKPVEDKKRLARILPRNVPHNQLAKLIKTKGQGRAFNALEELYSNLTSSTVRMKIYRTIVGNSMGKTMVRIKWPSDPFRGFKRVYIMSADFRNSQMYHLLCKDGHEPKKVTEEFMNKYLKGGYFQALETITKRHDHLVLAPLLDSSTMPSLNLVRRGMVVPKERMLEFLKVLEQMEISSQELKELSMFMQSPESIGAEPDQRQRKLLRYMSDIGCKLEVLKWEVNAATKIAKRWFSKNRIRKPDGSPIPGLLLVNKDYRDAIPVPDSDLRYFDVGKVEGRNDFIKCNMVVFLAGINPAPALKDVMAIEIPNYNPDDDYVVDKAIQCLGRGNIRDHASKEPMLAIVATSYLAERIADRMGDQPRIDMSYCKRLGSYTVWNTQEAKNLRRHVDRGKLSAKELAALMRSANKKKNELYLADPINNELNRLKNSLNYYLKKPPTTEKGRKKKAELENKIRALQARKAQ
jgi:hypothetical protein